MDAEWFARLEAERRAGNLTACERDVLKALGRLLAMGEDTPSEARLVSESGCARRTVQRAKARARVLNLLEWDRRFALDGTRRVELTCRYRGEMPAGPVTKRERQNGARNQKEMLRRSVEAQIEALPPVTPELKALWEARRQRRLSLGLAGIARFGG